MFHIRTATISDMPELKRLYKETILSVNRRDYPIEEIEDWASCGDDEDHLKQLITDLYFIVAINETSQITGFASITKEGYLHSMFVHKDFQRQGIASILYNTIEKYAKEKDIPVVTSEVSITAKPFFLSKGFSTDLEQKRKANKLSLTNYVMSKRLI